MALTDSGLLYLYQQAVEQRRAELGPDHPKVASSLLDLALYAKAQGNLTVAVAALRSAASLRAAAKPAGLAEILLELAAIEGNSPDRGLRLLEREGIKEPVSQRLAITLTNLGSAWMEKDPQLAERLHRQALRAWSATASDAEYASVLHNYASLLLATGRASRAEPLQRRALAIFVATLGEQHPRTATAAGNLAEITAALGKFTEAEALYRRALAADEQVYGPEHVEVAADLENLADLLEHLGRGQEAQPLRARAARIRAAR